VGAGAAAAAAAVSTARTLACTALFWSQAITEAVKVAAWEALL